MNGRISRAANLPAISWWRIFRVVPVNFFRAMVQRIYFVKCKKKSAADELIQITVLGTDAHPFCGTGEVEEAGHFCETDH